MVTEWTPLIASQKVVRSLVDRARLTSRQYALRESGVGQAAHLIKDAVVGHQDAPYEGYFDPYQDSEEESIISTMSVICGRLVVQLKGAVIFCSWVLFLLTVFEPPHWCRDASELQIVIDRGVNSDSEYGDCEILLNAYGTTADNQDNQQLYPNSGSMLLTIYQSKLIQLIYTCFISVYILLEFGDDGLVPSLFFYPGRKRWIHSLQCTVLICLFASVYYGTTIYDPFLRMVVLGSFLRKFQLELWTFMKMIPDLTLPLSMLAIIILFYAWFGVVLFNGSPQGIASFNNLAEACWTLWICVTTANYPDVMMLSYNSNRVVAIYFISFMALSYFYIMNLILAVAVNAYDTNINDRKISRAKLAKELLSEAFALLDHNNENKVSRSSILHIMTILNQDIPEIGSLSRDQQSILFAILDKDGNNVISRDEFLDFGNVLLLHLKKGSEYTTFVELHLPTLWRSNTYQAICKAVKSKLFDNGVEVVLVLNAVLSCAQDYPILAGQVSHDIDHHEGYIKTVWENFQTVFTLLYVVEASLKIIVNGWRGYIETPRNAWDFFITVLVVLSSVYVYYPNAYNNHDLIEFVAMMRVLRLTRILFRLNRFRIFGLVSLEIIPAAKNVFLVLLFIAYSFTTIGLLVFGGKITRDPSNEVSNLLLEANDWVESNYWSNSFNDMLSSFNVLFNLLVVNNWTIEAAGLEAATKVWQTRLFFLSFHILGVIGISNVITSFIINAFFQQMETVENRQRPEEQIGDKAVIRGSLVKFDPSNITGTKTGLDESAYYARIQPRHMDIEVDERFALKRLFTRTSTASSDNKN